MNPICFNSGKLSNRKKHLTRFQNTDAAIARYPHLYTSVYHEDDLNFHLKCLTEWETEVHLRCLQIENV